MMLKKISPWFVVAMVLTVVGVKKIIAGSKLKTQQIEQPKLVPGRGEDIRKIMHDFYRQIVDLRPAIESAKAFSSPKNQKTIRFVLSEFDARLEKVKDHPDLASEGNAATVSLFRRHIKQTLQWFDLKDLSRAYSGVRQTTEFCLSCHTHLPQKTEPEMHWQQDLKAQNFQNAQSSADFYFVTRRYEWSLNIYDELLRSYPDTQVNESQLAEIYRRKLLVFARVWRDPQKATDNLSQDLKNKKLPLAITKELETWRKSFQAWSAEKESPNGASPSDRASRLAFAQTILKEMETYRGPSGSHPYMVRLLRASGLLYEDLAAAEGAQDRAETLFYLGQVERILGQAQFSLLGDLYLKECVRVAPANSPWAVRCMAEYKSYLKWRYPQPKSLPQDLRDELDELEKKLTN